MSLSTKTVMVTGGLGGIGQPLVRLLVENGARVTVSDYQPNASVDRAQYIYADLRDTASIDALCKVVAAETPDILVNLAGLNAFCKFSEQSSTNINDMITVNLTSMMLLSRAALPSMIQRNHGQIVNIGSVVGSIGLPHFTVYAATKAGVKGFSEALRRELNGSGVSVTHIAPRAVRTPMNQGSIDRFNELSKTAVDSPENVAARILRAIEHKESNVTIGFPEKLFVKINALWPGVVDGPLNKNRKIGETILAELS